MPGCSRQARQSLPVDRLWPDCGRRHTANIANEVRTCKERSNSNTRGSMTFRFIHTSDWHIGKAFASFPLEKSALLRDARLTMIARIAEAARTHAAGHILVAGDIFDSPGLADAILRQALVRLSAETDLKWVLLPGNHDPDTELGLWGRIYDFGLPSNVVLARDACPLQLAEDVVLLPAPLSSKSAGADPTAWFDNAPRQPGTTAIGLAHGSAQSFGGGDDVPVAISPAREHTAGLDYLALGDWHGTKKIAERTWYSGTPEPDNFVENASGQCLAVQVAGSGAVPVVEEIETAQFSWRRVHASLGTTQTPSSLIEDLKSGTSDTLRTLLRVDVNGEIAFGDEAWLHDALQAVAASYFDVDIRDAGLRIVRGDEDDVLRQDRSLAAIADRISARSEDGESAEAEQAQRALQLLARYARAVAT